MLLLLLLGCDCNGEAIFCASGCESATLDLDERGVDAGWTPREMIETFEASPYDLQLGTADDAFDGRFEVAWDGADAVGTNCGEGHGIGFTIGVELTRDDGAFGGAGTADLQVTAPGEETFRLDVGTTGTWSAAVLATFADGEPDGDAWLRFSGDLAAGAAELSWETSSASFGYSDGSWTRAE